MVYQRQQIATVCGVCKRDFKGNSKQKYCSREYAARKQKEQLAALAEYRKKCPHCGELIGPMSGKHRGRNIAVSLTLPSLEGDGQASQGTAGVHAQDQVPSGREAVVRFSTIIVATVTLRW